MADAALIERFGAALARCARAEQERDAAIAELRAIHAELAGPAAVDDSRPVLRDGVVLFRGMRCELRKLDSAVLQVLLSRPGVPVPAEDIRKIVWGEQDAEFSRDALVQAVSRVRASLRIANMEMLAGSIFGGRPRGTYLIEPTWIALDGCCPDVGIRRTDQGLS